MDNMKFAVIGGDMRQAKLAELLYADGHRVSTFAIDEIENLPGVHRGESPEQAIDGAECVVLPLPIVSTPGVLSTPLGRDTHELEKIFSLLRSDQMITGGMIDSSTYDMASWLGLSISDYYAREELVVSNAVATAEGAIKIAMEETPTTLLGSKCLVIGFGRIGKILAHRLKGMGVEVTASGHSFTDKAWICAYGYNALDTDSLGGHLCSFDIIFNTVPARILNKNRLKEIRGNCLLIDLSSKPGGMDFIAAGNLGLKAVWALSLPGKVAPVTSGIIIKNTIYNMLLERGL